MDNILPDDMAETAPNKLFLQLFENASTRKKRSLERIHKACKNQYELKDKDFSIPTIAKLIASEGGPSEQGLRNKNGEIYRILINEWAKYSDGSIKKSSSKKTTGINDEILSNIPDPTTRALVGMLINQNKKLKRENSLLKEQTTFTIDMRESENKNLGINQDTVLVTSSPNLTEMELDALRHAISEEFMQYRGWTTDDRGRVKEKGVQIYKRGYVDAIKKILKEV